ncbi:zinc finger protein ZFP2-like isoform X1 [Topomyia yanbarensis]|uniref:zinc finger protein ZFP2-like isoform X1 n=1 Tax=Topomyia yanbarensis TaxID=2498891 RepID=UPI00273BA38B|nr:zinc finger protein ZFP2-like isoform X1 [Topomyia yanbarensis]
MNICRVCMDSDCDGLVPIFSKLEDAFIANIIVECTAVQIVEDDGLPTTICKTCIDDLKHLILFIKKARESDRKLRKIFKLESSKKFAENSPKIDGTNWEPELLPIAVFTEEIVEVKAEIDSDDDLVGENRTPKYESSEHGENVTDDNDSEWKSSGSSVDKSTVQKGHRGRKKKYRESTDSDSDSASEVRRSTRGRRRRKKPAQKNGGDNEDDSKEDDLDEKELATFKIIAIRKDQLVCCACLQIFDNRNDLHVHGEKSHVKKRRVNASKTNICEICFRRYSTPHALKLHKKRVANAAQVYDCTKCTARFIDSNRRRQHAHNHPREKEIIPSKVIVAPIPVVVQEEYGRICCAQACYQSFETEDLLIAHAHTIHKMNKVEQSLDENRDKPIECPVCFKRFFDEISLQRHQQRNYKPLSHQCSVCGLKLRGGEALATHERSHRNEKPFQCGVCHKYFTSKGSLKAHMMVHSGEKPFVCSTCGWSFRRKRNLQVHVLSHSNNQPFQCEVCQKAFKSKVHLQYHMRTHTGEKPYPCRFCDKAFADHTNRQRHEMSHTGIKPYKCSYCDKTFIRKRFQVDHESTHTGVKPYRCEMCNRTFSQKTALRRHLESHPLAPENEIALAAPSPMPAVSSTQMVGDSAMSPPAVPMQSTMGGLMEEPGPSASGYFQHPRNLSVSLHPAV